MKTDEQLQHDVIDALSVAPHVYASQIGVSAKDGVVTLTGEVSSYAEKWYAEAAAQAVKGVDALVVDLTVRILALGVRDDASIARAAQSVIRWDVRLPAGKIKVLVEDGVITLSGEVASAGEKDSASQALRHLIGVRDVRNEITLVPNRSETAARREIEADLMRREICDPQNIKIWIDDGVVTLTGMVRNNAERESANSAALVGAGITAVKNELSISDAPADSEESAEHRAALDRIALLRRRPCG